MAAPVGRLLAAVALSALLLLVGNCVLLLYLSADDSAEAAAVKARLYDSLRLAAVAEEDRAERPAHSSRRGRRTSSHGKGGQLHFAWVTDCSEYQEWQSLTLLWSIYHHQGPSTAVTRLISGCGAPEEQRRRDVHGQLFGDRSLELFFTSAHIRDEALNDTYPPYNRPHSVKLWTVAARIPPETMVVFLDPDMVMLSPLTLPMAGFEPEAEHIYRMKAPLATAQALPALGQRYKYIGARWDKANLSLAEICDASVDSGGCVGLDREEVEEHFSVGPPWIASFGDLRRAAPMWLDYAHRIRKQYRQLIAEMYAYSLAFASIGVRHALFDHFVLSYANAPVDEQAWARAVDGRPATELLASLPASGEGVDAKLPTFLHYCEIYFVEDWYWRKRNVPHSEVLECNAPLFAEPPADLLSRKVAALEEDRSEFAAQTARQAWFMSALTRSLNEALVDLKGKLCPAGFNSSRALRVPPPVDPFYAALQEFYKKN